MPATHSGSEKLAASYVGLEDPSEIPEASAQDAAEEHLQLLQLTHDAVLVRDAYNRIIFWNRAAESVYGWTEVEALGKAYCDLIDTRFPESLDLVHAKLFRENHWEGQVLQRRRDGKDIVAKSRLAVKRDFDGRPAAVFEINHDITQRIKTEEKLRQAAAQILRSQDEERRRIARYLHDGVSQTLTALAINLAIIQGSLNGHSNSKLSRILSETIDLARQSGDEIRNLSHLLHPPDLEAIGLLAAIRWYLNLIEKRYGVHVALDAPHELPGLSEDVKIALFRTVQESLPNLDRPACRKTIQIRVAVEAGHIIIVEIRGGGKQARLEYEILEGCTMPGMSERIRQLGGCLRVDHGPTGTTIRVRVPASSEGAVCQEPEELRSRILEIDSTVRPHRGAGKAQSPFGMR